MDKIITPHQIEKAGLTLLDCIEQLGFTKTEHEGLTEAINILRTRREQNYTDLYDFPAWTVVLLLPEHLAKDSNKKTTIEHTYATTQEGAVSMAQKNALHSYISAADRANHTPSEFQALLVIQGKVDPAPEPAGPPMKRFVDMIRPSKWRWTYCQSGKVLRGGFASTEQEAEQAAENWKRTYNRTKLNSPIQPVKQL